MSVSGHTLIRAAGAFHHLHHAERTSQHAGFTTDAFALIKLNALMGFRERPVWATAKAWRRLTVMAGYGIAERALFQYGNTRAKS